MGKALKSFTRLERATPNCVVSKLYFDGVVNAQKINKVCLRFGSFFADFGARLRPVILQKNPKIRIKIKTPNMEFSQNESDWRHLASDWLFEGIP